MSCLLLFFVELAVAILVELGDDFLLMGSPGCGLLVIAELAVFVGVELFEHLLLVGGFGSGALVFVELAVTVLVELLDDLRRDFVGRRAFWCVFCLGEDTGAQKGSQYEQRGFRFHGGSRLDVRGL